MDIETAAYRLETALGKSSFQHLRVKTRGQALTILSGKTDNVWPHARLSRNSPKGNSWRLSFPNRRGRWDKTPFVGSLDEMVALLTRDFAFHLHDFDSL